MHWLHVREEGLGGGQDGENISVILLTFAVETNKPKDLLFVVTMPTEMSFCFLCLRNILF